MHLILDICSLCATISPYNRNESRMRFPMNALESNERVMPMSVMEVLTLLLVIFAALSYIDDNKKK